MLFPISSKRGKTPSEETKEGLHIKETTDAKGGNLDSLMPTKFRLQDEPQHQVSTRDVDYHEWNQAVLEELKLFSLGSQRMQEFYDQSPFELKKYVQAVLAERLYWIFKDANEQIQQRKSAEAEFLGILENSSPEQRNAIELCINLTKAIRAIEIATNPSSSQTAVREAGAVFSLILREHPEIKTHLNYQVAREAFRISYVQNRVEPSQEYLDMLSRLSDEQRDWVYAARAAFFDSIINSDGHSQELKEYSATQYAKILSLRPHIQKPLSIMTEVSKGVKIASKMRTTQSPVEAKQLKSKWISIIGKKHEVRQIIFYQIAKMASADAKQSDIQKTLGKPRKGGKRG
jgi:hypothetical protein